MSKKLLALTLVFALVLACVPTFAAGTVTAKSTYRIDNAVTDSLSAGWLTVSLQILNTSGPSKYIAAVVYYDNEGRVLDFFAKTVNAETTFKSATLSISIPNTIKNDYYVRTLLMDAATLEPYAVNGGTITHRSPITNVETRYTGIYERYYTLDSELGSIAINDIAATYGTEVVVADTGTAFRLKDMGDGFVAFADAGALKRRLCNNEGVVGRRLYGFGGYYGGSIMLWKLEPVGDGRYYIYFEDTYDDSEDGYEDEDYSGYMSIEDGAVVISDTPCAFELNLVGESPFTLVTSLEGYELLSESEKQRLIEICTSAGAGVFPNGTNANSLLEIMEGKFSQIYDQRDTLSPERQKELILSALKTTPTYSGSGTTDELTDVSINDLPGGKAGIIRPQSPSRETLYIWDTGYKEYNRLDVTFIEGSRRQTIKFYYDEVELTYVEKVIEALNQFPYEYRQFLEQVNIYVPESGFSYNCDGPVLTVRVPRTTSFEAMTRGFAHELGHSIDMASGGNYQDASNHWCQSAEWKQAVEDDILPVSQYGNTNLYEGFAEFARLYFQCYGNRDRMVGLKQLYPNRYASFVKLLNKIGMEPLY